jgi:di/tricarboxylate transporter
LFKLNVSKIASILVTLLIVFLYYVPVQGLEVGAKNALLVFFWAIAMWILRPIPEYLSAIIAGTLLIVCIQI